MRTIIADLKRDIDAIKVNQGSPFTADLGWPSLAAAPSSSTSTVAPAASLSPQQFVSLEVHKTVKDVRLEVTGRQNVSEKRPATNRKQFKILFTPTVSTVTLPPILGRHGIKTP